LFWKLLNCSSSLLQEIVIRLQASGKNFIWVVKKSREDGEEWLPEEIENKYSAAVNYRWTNPVVNYRWRTAVVNYRRGQKSHFHMLL